MNIKKIEITTEFYKKMLILKISSLQEQQLMWGNTKERQKEIEVLLNELYNIDNQ